MGGTGILGKITGFRSIFVNGIEVKYNNKTHFTVDSKPVENVQLEIGDIVELLTLDKTQRIISTQTVTDPVQSTGVKTYLNIKILKLRKSHAGQLQLEQSINPQVIPRGQSSTSAVRCQEQNRIQKYKQDGGFMLREKLGKGQGTGNGNSQNGNRKNIANP